MSKLPTASRIFLSQIVCDALELEGCMGGYQQSESHKYFKGWGLEFFLFYTKGQTKRYFVEKISKKFIEKESSFYSWVYINQIIAKSVWIKIAKR